MIQKDKQEEHVSMDSVYGNKCLLHVTNIALFGIVVILAIVSVCIYYLMPVVDVTKLTKKIDDLEVDNNIQETESDGKASDTKNILEDDFYNIVATRNIFSPQRKDWVVKAVIPKASELKKKAVPEKKKAFAGKPKKFVLHGILIAGDVKKALINNPLKGVRKEKTLYVEEGEDLDGYKVKSIEKDRIKLDWNGEEIVVLLYSGAKDNASFQNQQNEVKKPRKRMKRLKVNKSDISIKKQNEAEKSLVASEVDIRVNKNDGARYVGNVFDDALFNPLLMAYDSISMQAKESDKVSGCEKKQEIGGSPYDINFIDTDHAEEEYKITKAETSGFLGVDPAKGINGKSISKAPTIFNLHRPFIVDDIRRAMIGNPTQVVEEKQLLCVEEGGDLDVFRAASKEYRFGLDMRGEEKIVALYSVINNYKEKNYAAEEIIKTMETIEENKELISTKENNTEVDGSSEVTEVDDIRKKCKLIISSVFDEEPLVLMYKSRESLYMAVIEDKKMPLLNDKQEIDGASHDINVVNIGNLSNEHELTNIDVSKDLNIDPTEGKDGKMISIKPAIINLHGIFIVDGIRKAMIEIPYKGIDKKKTLYVEEGDELDGCLVAIIDKEEIRLDCQGEERVVAMHSSIENCKQDNYVADGSNNTVEIIEADEEERTEKDNIAVDSSLLVASVDDEGRVDGKRILNVFDDEPFDSMTMAYESLFMPTMNDVTISVTDEIQEVVEELPDFETDNIDHSDQEQRFAMIQPTDSIYKVLEEEELKQKAISNVPTQIILKGIVIAGSIKKALVNVPMSKISENRTLYVEEGDELDEYLVTRIESAQIRLDWLGEEMIVTFPGSY